MTVFSPPIECGLPGDPTAAGPTGTTVEGPDDPDAAGPGRRERPTDRVQPKGKRGSSVSEARDPARFERGRGG